MAFETEWRTRFPKELHLLACVKDEDFGGSELIHNINIKKNKGKHKD